MLKCSWCGNEVKEYACAELCRTCSEADVKPKIDRRDSSVNVEAEVMPNEVLAGENLLKKFDEEIKKEKIEIEKVYEANKRDAINEGLRLSRTILKELLDESQREA